MLSAQTFVKFIEEQALFSPQDSLLVAVSGGMDSVALVDLLHQTGFKFSIAHCNFGLRGEESEGDEIFVRDLAESYGVACFRKYFNTKYLAEKYKISIQLVARQLRYEWFEALCQTYNYQYLLTAHHQNDVLETVLYNLVKGTGIAGLHGIKPKNGKIVRPLLCANKQEISKFVQKNNLSWREDSSNISSKYSRNLIRNEVVPLLKQINPNIEHTFQQTVEKISAIERVFEETILALKNIAQHTENEITYLDINVLLAQTDLTIKLYELLKPFHFNYFQTQQITESLRKEAGKTFISDTHTLYKDRNNLILTPNNEVENLYMGTNFLIEKNTQFIDYQGHKIETVTINDTQNFVINKEQSMAFLDKDKLSFPLVLRLWQDGDKFQPLGMKGIKKVSDFLNDKKIPPHLKNKICVLCNKNHVVWVVGYRIDERYKFTSTTKEIYKLSIV
jgi:tRNA(Ile)-lysidine synthase